MLQVEKERLGERALIKISGALDLGTADAFKQQLVPLLLGETEVVFNFCGIKFIDSTGVGAVLDFLEELTLLGVTVTGWEIGPTLFEILQLLGMVVPTENGWVLKAADKEIPLALVCRDQQ
ncbi:STAS domain-containing protein [Carboxydocella sp. JDF658]|uniref:STAS domain-containing protein n=1 Tax=Carboxydocella sp. JDF658 TaxID=1926600 RepID=UPI0009CBE2AF|nr:STAS domain-containing protein [Carboxydocella sp. JDF658]GAW31349.1 hypothetical protein JDF658_11140 [Carboxydocella sp. JDF658]